MNLLLKNRKVASGQPTNLLRPVLRIILSCLLMGGTAFPAGAQTFKQIRPFGVLTNQPGSEPMAPVTAGPDGTLYGVCAFTENVFGDGLVFKVQPDGSGYTVLKAFTNAVDGMEPEGGLTLDGNTLYGTMSRGGSNGWGTVFKINIDGSGFATLKNFGGFEAATPNGTLVLDGGFLYGVSSSGGGNLNGTVFKIDTNGENFAMIKSFAASAFNVSLFAFTNADGIGPAGGLALNNGVLYGTALSGGPSNGGTLFQVNEDGSGFGVLRFFSNSTGGPPGGGVTVRNGVAYGTFTSGSGGIFRVDVTGSNYAAIVTFTNQPGPMNPVGQLLVLNGSTLYGTSQYGGSNVIGYGTIFQVQTNGSGFSVINSFTGTNGAVPMAGVILNGTTLYGTTWIGGDFWQHGAVYKADIGGGGISVVHSFGYSDAAVPKGGLVSDGKALYGTTSAGGTFGDGTLFTVNPDGTGYTIFNNFSRSNSGGWDPEGRLLLSGTTLYGTTVQGGTASSGTLFKVDTSGSNFTVLKNFTNASGPVGGMVLINGLLYGATAYGGSNNMGTIFRVDTNGNGFTNIFEFGYIPYSKGYQPAGGLASDGTMLYGTTFNGGSSFKGVLYRIGTNGTGYSMIRQFTGGIDGSNPSGDLLYVGGRLYGSAQNGTGNNSGVLFASDTLGGFFLPFTTFQQVNSGSNFSGANPSGGLTMYSNVLYGTTMNGGAKNYGTLFKVNTNGASFTVLQNFTGTNGATPQGDLVVNANKIYGTTTLGGVIGDGTVFSLTFPPTLNIAPVAASGTVLTWPDPDFSLQSAPEASGTYSNISGATSPYTNAAAAPRQFFRLIQ